MVDCSIRKYSKNAAMEPQLILWIPVYVNIPDRGAREQSQPLARCSSAPSFLDHLARKMRAIGQQFLAVGRRTRASIFVKFCSTWLRNKTGTRFSGSRTLEYEATKLSSRNAFCHSKSCYCRADSGASHGRRRPPGPCVQSRARPVPRQAEDG